MKAPLYVLFTMDVEPQAAAAGSSGPATDEAGMAAIQAFSSVLRARGYCATYFVHPELVEANTDFYRQLREAGSGLGLHLHTTKFAPDPQPCELGGLPAAKQRRLIQLAMQMYERGLGEAPRTFRPGCFSANDETYAILCELGFRGGGVSIPGRIWVDRFCVWAGACPYIHDAHASFRQCAGQLPFVEIPLSVDRRSPLQDNPVGFQHYPDLRPGGVYSPTDEVPVDRRALLHNILQQMAQDDPPVKTLVIDVHNDRDFTGADSQAAADLRAVLDGIQPEAAALGWDVIPATYDEVIELYRASRPS